MNKNVWTIVSIVAAALMAAVAIVSIAKGGCMGMIETAEGAQVPMKCHWAFAATRMTGIAGCIIAILACVAKTAEGRRMASIASLVTAVATMAIVSPMGIGTCTHAESMCHGTATIVYALCAIVIIIALVQTAKANPEGSAKPKMQL